jgi:hypothetical protein
MSDVYIFDYVALVKNNPLTRLSSDYGSKIIEKIMSKFTDEDQRLFVANFYCYLNCNQKTDFVINLDRIWKWLGYGRVNECKTVLLKHFKENVDYKIEKAALEVAKAGPKLSEEGKNLGGAGLNREYITLTVNCFKKLCLKSRTEKADQIHDYYIGLEEILNELVSEQTQELKQKLLTLETKLITREKEVNIELSKLEEMAISISMDKDLVYLGICEENVVKFGLTRGGIRKRTETHKKEIGSQFTLKYTIVTDHCGNLEDLIKSECNREGNILFNRRFSKIYNGKNQTELIELDTIFTIEKLYNEILKLKELCDGDLVRKLMEENKKLKSDAYKEPILKKEILNKEEIKEILNDGIKCSSCSNISEPEKIGINKITGQYYSQCVDCRKKYSDLKMAKNETNRNQKEIELNNKLNKIKELREQLLNGTNSIKCFQCKKDKLPIDMGINKINNRLYKTCNICRDKNQKKNKQNDELIESNDITNDNSECLECSKCHKPFEIEYNETLRTSYKTCKICREKDKKNRENSLIQLDQENTIFECIYCKKDQPMELNAKKDGFYKSCKECREKRKKYDKKKNEIHRETILAKKKEHYQENKEEIRIKQKEYYDQNREYILASKAKSIKE